MTPQERIVQHCEARGFKQCPYPFHYDWRLGDLVLRANLDGSWSLIHESPILVDAPTRVQIDMLLDICDL